MCHMAISAPLAGSPYSCACSATPDQGTADTVTTQLEVHMQSALWTLQIMHHELQTAIVQYS